jgi:hypothetical protein
MIKLKDLLTEKGMMAGKHDKKETLVVLRDMLRYYKVPNTKIEWATYTYKMSRQQLCRYMDAVLPERGFFDIQSTSKIRLGCQLLRNFHLVKQEFKKNEV